MLEILDTAGTVCKLNYQRICSVRQFLNGALYGWKDQLLEKFLNARVENLMACGCVDPYKTVC